VRKLFGNQGVYFALFLGMILFAACGKESGPGPDGTVSVSGRMLDTAGEPLAQASVVFHSDPLEVVTGADGRFQLELPAGKHQLTVTARGRQIYDHQIDIPAGEQFDLGDLRPDQAFFQKRITLRGQGQYNRKYDYTQWCSVTVADDQGWPITGLGYQDFEIIESMVRISDGQTVAENVIPLKEQSGESAYDFGLFERSVTGQKLDIVFLTDSTGSFDDDGTDVRGEVGRFIEKLAAAHVDFRVAAVNFDETPDGPGHCEFYGPEALDLLAKDLDLVITTSGDGWDPTCAYDALLFTPYLGFRPEARKVAVLLTDIVPQTVYGTSWYSTDASSATRSAVAKFLEASGIELYYGVFEHPAPDFQYYCQPEIDPRACEGGNPRYGVEGSGLSDLVWGDNQKAVRLNWPFTADELWEKLALVETELQDSIYSLSWYSIIDSGDLSGGIEKYDYHVSLKIKDPQNPGQPLTTTFHKPADHPTATAEIQLLDEEGNPFSDAYGWLFVEKGVHRTKESLLHQQYPDASGKMVLDGLIPQRYFLLITDHGPLPHGFASLRAIAHFYFDLPPEGASFTLRVQTAERAADEAALGGLLQDLDSNWRLSGSPYRKFVREVNDWLYDCQGRGGPGILCNGLNWREQAAMRHLILVLGGYANLNEYAQLEAQRAVEDFQNIIRQVGELVKEIKKLQRSTNRSWKEALAAVALRVLLDVATGGSAEAVIGGIEMLLDELVDYLADYVFQELLDLMKEKIMAAAGIGPDHPLALMLEAGVALYHDWNFSEEGQDQNLELLWQAAQKLGLRLLVEETSSYVARQLVEEAFTNLSLDGELEQQLKTALSDLVKDAWEGALLGNFTARLQSWAEAAGAQLSTHTREQILAALDDIFEKWSEELQRRTVPENFCDFVLGFFQDLAELTVPELKNGRLVSGLKIDQVNAVLIKHAVYNLFLRERFVDDFRSALWEAF